MLLGFAETKSVSLLNVILYAIQTYVIVLWWRFVEKNTKSE